MSSENSENTQGRENLVPWKAGQSGNPNGRPRKFICTLKQEGYKISEVNDTLQVLLSLSFEELKAVYDDPKSTMLEKLVAKALQTSLKKGDIATIETLLSRVFGTPKKTIDMQGDLGVIINENRKSKQQHNID